jgi:voltage-gated potassium channel Kch
MPLRTSGNVNTRAAVLESVGIERARMFVVAISDEASSRQAVSLAQSTIPTSTS